MPTRWVWQAMLVTAVAVTSAMAWAAGGKPPAKRRPASPIPSWGACTIDLLDAGDGKAIRKYARLVRKENFHIAHTGLAQDPHERTEIFFTKACSDAGKALGRALGLPAADVQEATWKVKFGITLVPAGAGAVARSDVCDVEPDYACTKPGDDEDNQYCYPDWNHCHQLESDLEDACRTDCAGKDPKCLAACNACVTQCLPGDGGAGCRDACGKQRLACRAKLEGCDKTKLDTCFTGEGAAKAKYCDPQCDDYHACMAACHQDAGDDADCRCDPGSMYCSCPE